MTKFKGIKIKRRGTISSKLSLFTAFLVFVFIIVITVIIVRMNKIKLEEDLKAAGSSLALTLSSTSASAVINNDHLFLQNLPKMVSHEKDLLYLILVDDKNKCLVHTEEKFLDKVLKNKISQNASQFSKIKETYIQEYYDEGSGYKAYDIAIGMGVFDQKWATLRVGISTRRLATAIKEIYLRGLILGVIVAIFCFLISFFVSKRITRTIFAFKNKLDQLQKDEKVEELVLKTGDEMEEISNSFNKVLRIWKEKTEELNTLFNLSTEIVSSLSIDKVLNKIMKVSLEMLNAETGSLMLIDENTKKLYIKASVGLDEEIVRNTVLKMGERIAGWIAKNGEPLLFTDGLKNDPRFSHLEEREEIKSSLCVPLKIKDTVIGVLNVNNLTSATNFTEKDLELLLTFANQAAVAIENANLYEKERKQRRELEEKIEELERFNKLTVGRELRMIELKEEINSLLEKLGQPKKYEAPEKIKSRQGGSAEG